MGRALAKPIDHNATPDPTTPYTHHLKINPPSSINHNPTTNPPTPYTRHLKINPASPIAPHIRHHPIPRPINRILPHRHGPMKR